jgi:uncharacterized SAM-binding protein YcdF (DUF218 family)
MELLITNTLQSLIFPPGIFLLLLLLGLLLLRFRPMLAQLLLWSSLITGYLLSTTYISGALLRQLQEYPALAPEEIATQVKQSHVQAIVVLSSNGYKNAPEYGRDTVGDATLERVRYGAFLQRHSGLPMVVSGGHVLDTKGDSLAAVMAETLQHDFGVKQVWLEDRSSTTAENAIYTQQLLKEKGIDTVLLVTHSYHMPRAVEIFEKSGLKVIPAPTVLVVKGGSDAPRFMSWLPYAGAMQESFLALHELVGRVWYWIRY